ncbi:MAG: ABC transporter permease [Geminicoccaceae bacterium]|nr:ABC transporter permease [Geminicoccaceae bacterium]HRY27485.1 ABC transporter permease [Geminicoccaceae bacterium]
MATEAVAVARDEGWLARLRRNRVLRRLRQHKLFLTGFALFAVVLVMAVFAPLIAPLPPDEIQFRHRFEPPSLAFPMGTDNFGRDLLSRVVYGARLSLEIGFTVVLLTGIFGTAIGAAAGYYRKLDNPLMRVMDALMAFPAILLAVAIAAALGASAVNAVIALAAVYTPRTARIVRASVLVVREMEYVQAARACGATNWRIMRRHILPNSMAPLIVQLTFIFAYAVLAEAILSFLGVGPEPPTPTWGNIVAEGRQYIREAPWITLFPGLAIAMTVLGLNLLGDGLRDALDPRMRVQQG